MKLHTSANCNGHSSSFLAERVGLEPTNPLTEITVFETVRIAIPCTSPIPPTNYTSKARRSEKIRERGDHRQEQ